MFDNLTDNELDALLIFKEKGKLDAKTLESMSDDALDAMLTFKKPVEKVETFTDNIDHSIVPKLDADGNMIDNNPIKEKTLWEKTKKIGRKIKRDIVDPLLIGSENVANALVIDTVNYVDNEGFDILPEFAPIKLTDSPTLRNSKDLDDVDMDTYLKIGALSKTASGFHDMGIGKVNPEDVKAYEDNLAHLLIDRLGYADVGQADDGKYYVTDKEGKITQLNKSTAKTILAEAWGDKAEWLGAMVGGKKGYDLTKIGGKKTKLIGGLVGGAVGAAFGNITDQFISVIKTGETLSWKQRREEVGKAVAMDLAGGVAATTVLEIGRVGYKASKKMKDFVTMAKDKNMADEFVQKAIDNMAKIPDQKQTEWVEALEFASENNIKLTSTSVLHHPQVDQFVQVLARNSFIKQGIEKQEEGSRKRLIAELFTTLEEAGPKASSEEVSELLEQELKLGKEKHKTEVDSLYDDFKERSTGQIVSSAKTMLRDIKEGVGGKYGFLDEGEIFDDEIRAGMQYVNKLISPRADGNRLGTQLLKEISEQLGGKAQSSKMSNPSLSSFYSGAKKRVNDEIEMLSQYQGDDVARTLVKAKTAYAKREKIYGKGTEFSKILELLKKDKPNEAIVKLLKGAKGLDNATMLNAELKGTREGEALLGALGRKQLDEAFTKLDQDSSIKMSEVLDSNQMHVAKRLLGEEKSKKIEKISTLFRMLGRTENLLSGTGAAMATNNVAPIDARLFEGAKGLLLKLQEKRLFGKFFDNTVAQDLLLKALQRAEKAKTPQQQKVVNDYIRQTARVLQRDTGVDFSDVYDKRKIRQTKVTEKKAQEEAQKDLTRDIEFFTTPSVEEWQTVQKLANNDNLVELGQSIGRISNENASPQDIERYLNAKNSINVDDFSKGIEKEKISRFNLKYKDENINESIENIEKLRDYLMSHSNLKMGYEFNGQSVKALLSDLETKGVPRNVAHDKIYDEALEMYEALKPRIDEAYPPKAKKIDEPLDVDGNPLFTKLGDNLFAGTITGLETDEDGYPIGLDAEKFILGLGGYTVAKQMLKNPKVQKELKILVEEALSNPNINTHIVAKFETKEALKNEANTNE